MHIATKSNAFRHHSTVKPRQRYSTVKLLRRYSTVEPLQRYMDKCVFSIDTSKHQAYLCTYVSVFARACTCMGLYCIYVIDGFAPPYWLMLDTSEENFWHERSDAHCFSKSRPLIKKLIYHVYCIMLEADTLHLLRNHQRCG